jgi:hypothetical protein
VNFRQGGAGSAAASEGDNSEMEDVTDVDDIEHQEPDTLEERERFWKEVGHTFHSVYTTFTRVCSL